jgi:hypothetical protein
LKINRKTMTALALGSAAAVIAAGIAGCAQGGSQPAPAAAAAAVKHCYLTVAVSGAAYGPIMTLKVTGGPSACSAFKAAQDAANAIAALEQGTGETASIYGARAPIQGAAYDSFACPGGGSGWGSGTYTADGYQVTALDPPVGNDALAQNVCMVLAGL